MNYNKKIRRLLKRYLDDKISNDEFHNGCLDIIGKIALNGMPRKVTHSEIPFILMGIKMQLSMTTAMYEHAKEKHPEIVNMYHKLDNMFDMSTLAEVVEMARSL